MRVRITPSGVVRSVEMALLGERFEVLRIVGGEAISYPGGLGATPKEALSGVTIPGRYILIDRRGAIPPHLFEVVREEHIELRGQLLLPHLG